MINHFYLIQTQMPTGSKKDENTYPIWWDEAPEQNTITFWQQAMEDYISFHDADVDQLQFGIDLVKKIIPHVAVRDPRWKKFPLTLFNTNQYDAHAKLYESIHNKFTSLKKKA